MIDGLVTVLKETAKEVGESIKSNFPNFFNQMREVVQEKDSGNDVNFQKNDSCNLKNEFLNYPFNEEGELIPNITYESEGYMYSTDDKGAIIKTEGNLRLENGIRNENAQLKVGGEDRRPGDQGGHLIGRQFGGSGNLDNLVAMKGELNQGDYKRMEMDWRKALAEGHEVYVKIDVNYKENSKRPTTITVNYTIDSEKTKKVFDNN